MAFAAEASRLLPAPAPGQRRWRLPVPSRQATAALCLLAVAAAIFYRRHLLGDAVIPYDSKDQSYIFARFAAESYRMGRVPLWNPYLFNGYPAGADPLYFAFNPAMLLFVLPGTLSQTFFDTVQVLHVVAFGFGCYLLGREFRLSWTAAVLAGLGAMLGGPMAARAQSVQDVYAIAYFPFALLLFKQALDRPSAARIIAASVVLAPALISGAQLGLLIAYSLGFYFLFRTLSESNRAEFLRSRLAFVLLFFGGAAGLAAVQVLPSIEFSGLSNRAGMGYAEASGNSLWPGTLLTAAVPNFFGATGPITRFWGYSDPTEGDLYFGAALLLGVVFAVFRLRHEMKKPAAFFVFLGVGALIYSLGRHTPFFHVLFNFAPGVSAFQRPTTALYLLNFSLVMAGGWGFDLARTRLAGRDNLLVATAIVLAMLVAGLLIDLEHTRLLFHLRPDRIAAARASLLAQAAAGLTVLFAFMIAVQPSRRLSVAGIALLLLISVADLTLMNGDTPHNSVALASRTIGRGSVYDRTDVISFLRQGTETEAGPVFRVEPVNPGSLWSNGPALWRLASTNGYSASVPRRFYEFSSFSSPDRVRNFSGLVDGYNTRLFDLTAARFIVNGRDLKAIDPKASPEKLPLVFNQFWRIYENEQALPRAFLVFDASVINDGAALKREMKAPDFDPGTRVLLEGDETWSDWSHETSPPAYTLSLSDEANRMTIDETSPARSYLVLSDVYYPGWEVSVDGRRAPLLRADYAFRAVPLEAGRHRVEFRFRPHSFFLGAGLTAGTAVVLALILWISCFGWGRRGRLTTRPNR